ncbi:MAG TPA: glycosyltransferase family 4 protein [Albitalea sp.]|nr:glycosyltransferase family 4 protein [Albitalea sp.]
MNAVAADAKPVLVVGSASIHVARFVRGLCDAGQAVVLATHGELSMAPHPLLLEQHSMHFGVANWRAPAQLRALMARVQPRVLHAHQANSVGWHAARAAAGGAVPLVLTLWGSDVLSTPSRSPFHRWMVGRALRGANAWTADARVLIEAGERLAGRRAERIEREWIPLGIDTPPAPSNAQERRILSCRLHKPLYRIDSILRAFARLPARLADWRLEVAADGPQAPALKQLAHELGIAGRVEFTGMLDPAGLARSYRRAAIFVSVPTSDGTSVSLLEAMGAGCTPVLSDLPANREWVVDGSNGWLVDDLASLDQALLHAIERWESGAWAREGAPHNAALIRERAYFPTNIRQFLALYARLAG